MTPDRQPSPDDPVVSIVPHSDNALIPGSPTDYLEASVTSIRPSPVEAFLTPWGIGSIFIFLLANSLLTWSQLVSPTPENSLGEVPAPVKETKTTALSLDTLPRVAGPVKATVKTSPLPTPTGNVPVTPRPIATIPLPPAKPVTPPTRPTGNLAGALLSPSLQPALMPAHTLPVNQIRQSLPAVAPAAPAPIVSIEAPKPPPPVGQNPAPAPALLNERMVEELRRREEAATNQTLFQREKTRRMNLQNQREANELPKRLTPRRAGQPSPATETRSSIDSQPRPTAPGTIIIDRSGDSVNQ